MSFPNLIIAGAPKSGTTSVFMWLKAHPSVVTSQDKETYYLIDADYPFFNEESNYLVGGLEGYSSLFPDYASGQLCIEATPDYMYQKTALRVLSELPAQPTIVFLLRNPVERVLSLVEFAKNNVGSLERSSSLRDLLHPANNGSFTKDPILNSAFLHGEYYMWVRKWVESCGKSRVKVLFFEDMVNDPASFMKKLCGLSGIDGEFYRNFDFKPENQSRQIRSGFLLQYKKIIQDKAPILMKSETLKRIYRMINIRSESRAIINNLDSLHEMYEYFEEPNKRLSSLLDNELPITWSRKVG